MKARWAVLLALLVLATGRAQGDPEPRYGPPVGSRVELGVPLPPGSRALLVVFSVPARFCLAGGPDRESPEACFRHLALARAWARDYPRVRVLVVEPRSPAARVRELAGRLGGAAPAGLVTGDEARALARRLSVNRSPLALLLDREGRVRAKLGGFGPPRWLAFEAQVAAAARGAWERVEAGRMHELVPGRPVGRWLPGLTRGERFTLVVNLWPGCWPCGDLARDLVRRAPELLAARPGLALNVTVLAEDGASVCRAVQAWDRRLGPGALGGDALSCRPPAEEDPQVRLFGGPPPGIPGFRVVPYRFQGVDDVGRWWGMFTAPSAALIAGDRVLAGPHGGRLLPYRYRVGRAVDFSSFWERVYRLTEVRERR